ncbi:MAG: 50S ribosomal protein L25 [Bacteroidales bacterium]|nr:50S ribosomal protein L25 [Bacteroidales bacterium]
MKHLQLNGQLRKLEGGKATIKALRRQGLVPCNLYGQGINNVLFCIDTKELKKLTNTPDSYIVDLVLDSGEKYKAVLHESQWHPVTDEPLHMDFLLVTDKKPVVIDVPIVVTGHSEGVKMGGKLLVSARKLRVSAPENKLPDTIEVDTTNLLIGKQIVAGDLNIEGVEIVSSKATIICSVRPTRSSAQENAAAE